jgi:hypothetical protein
MATASLFAGPSRVWTLAADCDCAMERRSNKKNFSRPVFVRRPL